MAMSKSTSHIEKDEDPIPSETASPQMSPTSSDQNPSAASKTEEQKHNDLLDQIRQIAVMIEMNVESDSESKLFEDLGTPELDLINQAEQNCLEMMARRGVKVTAMKREVRKAAEVAKRRRLGDKDLGDEA